MTSDDLGSAASSLSLLYIEESDEISTSFSPSLLAPIVTSVAESPLLGISIGSVIKLLVLASGAGGSSPSFGVGTIETSEALSEGRMLLYESRAPADSLSASKEKDPLSAGDSTDFVSTGVSPLITS